MRLAPSVPGFSLLVLFLCAHSAPAAPNIHGGYRPLSGEPGPYSTVAVTTLPEFPLWAGCTGTLIGDHLLVTAAHCIASKAKRYVFFEDPDRPGQGEFHEVTAMATHPLYRGAPDLSSEIGADYDVGWAKFEGEIPYGFRPIPILPDIASLPPEAPIIATGYGTTATDRPSPTMLSVPYRLQENPFVTPLGGHLYGGSAEEHASGGDSGGPIYAEVEGQWHVIGATSRQGVFYESADVLLPPHRYWLSLSSGVSLPGLAPSPGPGFGPGARLEKSFAAYCSSPLLDRPQLFALRDFLESLYLGPFPPSQLPTCQSAADLIPKAGTLTLKTRWTLFYRTTEFNRALAEAASREITALRLELQADSEGQSLIEITSFFRKASEVTMEGPSSPSRAQIPSVDLSPLSQLPMLLTLKMNRVRPAPLTSLVPLKSLRQLAVSQAGLTDIAPLAELSELQALDISDNEVSDLSPLVRLTHLRTLRAIGNPIDHSDIAKCPRGPGVPRPLSDFCLTPPSRAVNHLPFLDFCLGRYSPGTTPTEKAAIADTVKRILTQLREPDCTEAEKKLSETPLLDLYKASSIVPLRGLEGLKILYLSESRLEDLSPLSTLTGLENLYLSNVSSPRGNALHDLSVIAALINLRVLEISSDGVESLSPLKELHHLESLNASSNQIADLGPLSGLTNLRALALQKNKIHDLAPLSSLTALEQLALKGNPITSLSSLTGLSRLEFLSASDAKISVLPPLSGMRELKWAYLGNNAIADIEPLSGLPKLYSALLQDNQIVRPVLHDVPRLRVVSLKHNKVEDLTGLAALPRELVSLFLDDNPLGSTIPKTPQNCPRGEGITPLVDKFCRAP